jgi:hypothetical protein
MNYGNKEEERKVENNMCYSVAIQCTYAVYISDLGLASYVHKDVDMNCGVFVSKRKYLYKKETFLKIKDLNFVISRFSVSAFKSGYDRHLQNSSFVFITLSHSALYFLCN